MNLHRAIFKRISAVAKYEYWYYSGKPLLYLRDHIWITKAIAVRLCSRRLNKGSFGTAVNLPFLYINLDSRSEKRAHFEEEFRDFPLSAVRVPGILHPIGLVGCALAHHRALSIASDLDAEGVIVAEDDAVIVGRQEALLDSISEFMANPMLDVLCLANRVNGPLIRISDRLCVSNNIQTAAMYVVKKRAIKFLVTSNLESVTMLLRGEHPRLAANDTRWKKLQQWKLTFAVPRNRCVVQRPGFSDTHNVYTNYGV